MTAVIVSTPVRHKTQTFIYRYFYRGAYDYFDTLIAGSKAMVSILHRDELLRFLVNRVTDAIYISGAAFFLKGQDGVFRLVAEKRLDGRKAGKEVPLSGSALLSYLEQSGEVLLQTDLRALALREQRELLAAEMTRLDAEVAVPVLMQGRLTGVFFLGPKMSGEPYSNEDVKLLSALASQLTVSLRNAQLYQEVLTIKRYLESVLENMGNGLIAVDAAGRITTFNGAAERLTGRSAGTAVGKRMDDVLGPELCRLLHEAVRQGRTSSEVEVALTVDGSGRYLGCSTAVMKLPETGERGAILVMSDVTRIKNLERERSQVQRLASLGQVAAGLAHEIKNPLVSIKTFAELLPEKYDNHEFRHNFSRIVSQEIERINRLLGELLNFTKDSPKVCETVDIPALLDEILLLLSPQIEAHNITVEKQYQAVPPVRADKNQLKQAIFNICLNSIQAMPDGGELRVRAWWVPVSEDENADPAAPGGKVKILVEDTGMGISAQQRDRVFDPFFTTKADGVGIGLSISHKIIVDHGGSIQIHSREGEGAAFEICLPPTGQRVA